MEPGSPADFFNRLSHQGSPIRLGELTDGKLELSRLSSVWTVGPGRILLVSAFLCRCVFANELQVAQR